VISELTPNNSSSLIRIEFQPELPPGEKHPKNYLLYFVLRGDKQDQSGDPERFLAEFRLFDCVGKATAEGDYRLALRPLRNLEDLASFANDHSYILTVQVSAC